MDDSRVCGVATVLTPSQDGQCALLSMGEVLDCGSVKLWWVFLEQAEHIALASRAANTLSVLEVTGQLLGTHAPAKLGMIRGVDLR